MKKSVLLLFVVLLAGCGSGDETTGKSTPPAAGDGMEPAPISAAPADRTRKTGNLETKGGSIHFEDVGIGEALILIHGGYLDGRMWDPQMESLSREHRVIRYDVRGYGRSLSTAGNYSHHVDLARLMDHLSVDRATLIGLSLGGGIAIDFAITYPERVSALVLASPGLGGFPFKSPELARIIQPMAQAHREGDLDKAVELFQQAWTDGPHRTAGDIDPDLREFLRSRILENLRKFNPGIQLIPLNPPAVERLSTITVPVISISGSLDMPDVLEVVDLITAKVPGAMNSRIEGVAHMVTLEDPEEFNKIVLDFLAGI
jgi:3-oxoadipate enol-lactonase